MALMFKHFLVGPNGYGRLGCIRSVIYNVFKLDDEENNNNKKNKLIVIMTNDE